MYVCVCVCVCVCVITGSSNGPVLFCSLASLVVVCRLSSVTLLAGRAPGARAVRRPTLHGGPVVLRSVRATPSFCKCNYRHSLFGYYRLGLLASR